MSKKVGLFLFICLMLVMSSASAWADDIGIMSHVDEVIDRVVTSQVKYTGQLVWIDTSTDTYYKTIKFTNGYDYTTKTTYTEPVFHMTDQFGNGYFTREKIVTYIYTTY